MKTVIRGALTAALLSAASASALAADLPSMKAPPPPPVVVDDYQPFQIRLKVGGVIPTTGNGTTFDAGAIFPGPILAPFGSSVGIAGGISGGLGTVIPNASTNTSWSVIPMLDAAYYINKNFAIEAICCVTHHHIQGTGEIASDFARTWLFPPSLLFQYHFTNFGAFQPYLGVGVNFTTFWGTRVNGDTWGLPFAPGSFLANNGIPAATASFYSATVTPSWGVVGQVGMDYMINQHWGVNLDVKYITMAPTVHANVVAFTPAAPSLGAIFVPVTVHLPIDPIIVSAGVTYRFGGGMVAPIFAKY